MLDSRHLHQKDMHRKEELMARDKLIDQEHGTWHAGVTFDRLPRSVERDIGLEPEEDKDETARKAR